MALKSITCTNTEITLVFSDNAIVTLTKAEIQTIYQGTSGNAAKRKADTIAQCKTLLVQKDGGVHLEERLITNVDFDPTNNTPPILIEITEALPV